MKQINILFLLFLISFCNAQSNLDLSEIKKNVNDTSSPYFYEKLVYQFNYDPNLIDSIEAKHLYYGKLYADYKAPNTEKMEVSNILLNDLINTKKFPEAIEVGEQLIRKTPADIEVLGLLMYSFIQQKLEKQELTYLRGYQFKKLINAVFESRSGDNKHPVFTVTSVTDEFVLAGILDLDLKEFRRKTTYNDLGAIDYWKKGKKKLSFQVIYEK